MVQFSQTRFDASFAALSDPVRRGVLERLMHADASVTALAEQFRMTLTGMRKRAAILAESDEAAAELLQHSDVRVTRRHYRNTAAKLKPVR